MRKVIDIQMKFGEVDISKDDYYYPLQTLKDNLSLFTPEVLDRSKECRARTGEIKTPHGDFETPVFMPVGTKGSVKAVSPEDLDEAGARIILANTYHLYLRPGHHTIGRLGGLHRFMNWPGPILTDSGGFQVYSLTPLRTITDKGVIFQSHIDGSKHFIGPEEAIDIQETLGADIIMAFDECAPYSADYAYVERSVKLTTSWARRSIDRSLLPAERCQPDHSTAAGKTGGYRVAGKAFPKTVCGPTQPFQGPADFPGDP